MSQIEDIAEHLDDIAAGALYENEHGEYVRVMNPEAISEDDELTEVSIYDYLDDNFGCWFLLDWDLEVIGGRIMVAFGGPNIYIDASAEEVQQYWGFSVEKTPLTSDAVALVIDYLKEVYESRRCASR